MKKTVMILSAFICMMLFSSCTVPETDIIENSPSQTIAGLPENSSTQTSSQAEPQKTVEADPSTLLPFIGAQGKYGYMDNQGNVIIKPTFDFADRFSEGIAVVAKVGKEGYKAGYIDGAGKIVIPFEYDYAFPVSGGIATTVVRKPESDTTVYLDTSGKELLRVNYYVANPFHEGLAAVKEAESSRWRYMDITGKFVIDTQFDTIGDFHEGKARFSKSAEMGYIDKNGNVVLDGLYYASDFSGGLAAVRKDGIWGYINEDGEFVLSFETLQEYDQLYDFYEGMALILVNNLFGVIDRDGEYVKQPQYEAVGGVFEGLIMLYDVDKEGGINGFHYETLDGQIVEPEE
jgi:hypothetical protein